MQQQYSIYNALRVEKGGLLDLLRPQTTTGIHAARNLKKSLNHLDILVGKEATARLLNLHHTTPDSTFKKNYAYLALHQQGIITTQQAITQLSSNLFGQGVKLNEKELATILRAYVTVAHMEFHPSDNCNLACHGCTYSHDDPERKPLPVSFPYAHIGRIATLRPRGMVIVGGGEPGLYLDAGHRLGDVVEEIAASNPGISLGLITNGTIKPKGAWPQHLNWVRISVDATTKETYTHFRGKDKLAAVLNNYLSYLDSPIPHVGVSYLFSKANISEYASFHKMIYKMVKQHKPHLLHKVSIHDRPLRRDPRDKDKQFLDAITEEEISVASEEILHDIKGDKDYQAFLTYQTNITAIEGGNTHPPHDFSRCHYSQIFTILRANGALRPCFIRVGEEEHAFALGNFLTDPLEKIALNKLYIATRLQPDCDPEGCRQCHVNYILEQGLAGNMQPSQEREIMTDSCF